MRAQNVPLPKPGLLYWQYGNEARTEGSFACVFAEDGCVIHRQVWIGPNGVELVEDLGFRAVDGHTLERALAGLYADQVWRLTGEKVGRYADPPIDLDGLTPAARQVRLDEFAGDLEARRDPRHRYPHAASTAELDHIPTPEPESELAHNAPVDPAPVAEPAAVTVSKDPQYEPWKAPRESELARRMAWGPGWDL
jgi:hypothetical protein